MKRDPLTLRQHLARARLALHSKSGWGGRRSKFCFLGHFVGSKVASGSTQNLAKTDPTATAFGKLFSGFGTDADE